MGERKANTVCATDAQPDPIRYIATVGQRFAAMASIRTDDAGRASTHRAMGTAAALTAPAGAVPAAAAGGPATVVSKSMLS